jgi:hypothetical protein
LIDRTKQPKGHFIAFPTQGQIPVEPDYEDAVEELNHVLKQNDAVENFLSLEKNHPEVGMFYITEDKQKMIVIYKDGAFEKYGYPGLPPLAEAEKKFEALPAYFFDKSHPVNGGYLARWAEISAQAEKEFHTTSKDVRAIIFPGDSRVIVAPVSGKVRFYDMDNDAEKERTEFERLYGKLPDCVPKAGFNSDEMERGAGWPPHKAAAVTDTAPAGKDSLKVIGLTGRRGNSPDSSAPLYIVDGKKMPPDWQPDGIPPQLVNGVEVLGPRQASAIYGEQGKHGAVQVTTKDPGHDWSREKGKLFYLSENLKQVPNTTGGQPLLYIDGKEVAIDSLKTLNPQRIESIQVFKDSTALKRYGEKAGNGVLLVTLKHEQN